MITKSPRELALANKSKSSDQLLLCLTFEWTKDYQNREDKRDHRHQNTHTEQRSGQDLGCRGPENQLTESANEKCQDGYCERPDEESRKQSLIELHTLTTCELDKKLSRGHQ